MGTTYQISSTDTSNNMAAPAPAPAPAILLQGGTLLFHDDKDHVSALKETDILIQGNRISKIGRGIRAPAGAELFNCSGKIVSPGFVDTHHHLWQTQLKGCHAEQSIFDYLVTGSWVPLCVFLTALRHQIYQASGRVMFTSLRICTGDSSEELWRQSTLEQHSS